MNSIYTITIKNNSMYPRSFILFQDIPTPSNIPSRDVFTNVYQRAVGISGKDEGEALFEISSECFVVHGTSTRSDMGMITVKTSDYKPVKLGPQGSRFYLTNRQSPTTDDTFSSFHSRDLYFGVGAKDLSTGRVVPVQTYHARPGNVALVFPKVTYHTAFGNYQPGSIVDLITLGRVLTIDFTGCKACSATFILNQENMFVPDPKVQNGDITWRVVDS
ncbi:unnamed protein product [Fusarium graminearum]|uniref:Chromosome 2, complete genome n=1 Tax=Gibberella zeae (strain ATCC MYA-4620 / CBS 123657 / FGSC 9075 / NRRL 31084 / PH-1) TaxID=229533 RepID=A0A098DC37_GIBZE|nr:hypothetical protein HG531_005701 [Fusarium graminearum]CAF3488608.1 unnamed protein product [Fusarium graminearum]CAF3490570.1 unnamed protein product [Fusarium graminearum]CEF76498.1 unnamed protein product [Fusarium graminearum]CZS79791.1 unnamed protein product [Fusarium graminearum]